MYSRYLKAIILALSLSIGIAVLPSNFVHADELPKVLQASKPKLIVIDPGHGGSDPGAVRSNLKEVDLNNKLAVKVANGLKKLGYTVIFTREPLSNQFMELADRASFANSVNADLFISIHHDASTNAALNGTSVHYSSYRPGVDENDVFVLYNGGSYRYLGEGNRGYYMDYNGVKKFVSIDSAMAIDKTPSKQSLDSAQLAAKLVTAISSTGIANKGTKDHNLYVTRKTNMPSVLIEAGFISNATEAKKLSDDNFQTTVSERIISTIDGFLGGASKPAVEEPAKQPEVPKVEETSQGSTPMVEPPKPVETPQANTPVVQPSKPVEEAAKPVVKAEAKPVVVQKKGWVTEQGGIKRYYDMSTGAVKTGWQAIDNRAYYFDSNGVLVTGWRAINNKAYYFDSNGVMATGWKAVNNKAYYFGTNGVMTTGWLTYNNNKFYFDSNGIMKTGWVTIGNRSYYFKPDGSLAVNTTIGKYRVGRDGARIR